MKTLQLTVTFLLCVLINTQIIADGLPALKEDVDSRFVELSDQQQQQDDAISANTDGIAENALAIAAIAPATTYDIHNYMPDVSIGSAEFSVANGGSFTRLVHVYSPNEDYSVLDNDRIAYDALGNQLSRRKLNNAFTDTAYVRTGITFYSLSGEISRQTVYEPAHILAGRNVVAGSFWSEITNESSLSDPTVSSLFFSQSNFVAIEDVTVPYNGGTTFQNCMKVTNIVNNVSARMTWFCEGHGMVKQLRSNGEVIELTNLLPPAP